MTEYIIKKVEKSNQSSSEKRAKLGRISGSVGIASNIVLCISKLVIGVLSSSVSIIADGINNLSDASSSVITLLGFRLAQKPADEEHPYGHARYEYIAGLVVASFIMFIGFSLAKSSFEKIINPVATAISAPVFVVLILSVAVKFWLASFYFKIGKRISSETLKASATDSRNDVITTIAVIIGCIVGYFFDINIDGYIGFAVAIFIIISGVGIVKDTLSLLLGKKADPSLVDEIKKEILSEEKVIGLHDLLIHDYGPGQCFASVHVEMSADESPLLCHEIIDEIERRVQGELNVHLVIHYDPVVMNDKEKDLVSSALDEILLGINKDLSIHDLRILKGSKRNKLFFDLEVPFSMNGDFSKLKEKIDKALNERHFDYRTIINFDRKTLNEKDNRK